MNKKQGLATASLSFAVALLLAGCGDNSIGLNDNSIGAATDLYKAATLTDEQVRTVALGAAKEIDGQHTIAPPSSPYAARLAKITKGHENEDGLQFNYKVYLTKEINAFAMADGAVRVYSGLLDVMSDDEVRFILGHEIGHAKLGHIRKATQTAYGASAARKAAAASGNQVVSALSASELGSLGETLLNAQFSQSQEYDADAYGIDFLKRNHYSLSAAVTAMQIIANSVQGSDGTIKSWFSSHPTSTDRVAKLKAKVEAEGGNANPPAAASKKKQ